MRLEALDFSLSSSNRKMGILGPVVVSQSAWTVPLLATESFHGSRVGSQSVSDDGLRHEALVLEKFSQQFQCGGLVPALLDQDIEDLAFLVDSPPHVHPYTVYPDHHFIEVPHAIGTSALAANVRCDRRPELVGPATDGFIGHIDPSFSEQILDVAQAQSEAIIEPDSEPDHVRREAMALEGNGFHLGFSIRLNGR